MAYLTAAQRCLLAPENGDHPRDGFTVPMSTQAPFVNADSWAWALNGEYVNPLDPYSADTVYSSDNGAFVFDEIRVPMGLNTQFFATTDMVFPQTVPYHMALANNFSNALAGNLAAQDACRIALMKLIVTLNGHTVLADNGSPVYTIAMKTSSWFSWDHWAVGVQGSDGGDTTYQQKVAGSVENQMGLQYNCGVMWDEEMPLTTTIRVDGLLQSHVDMLNQVV